MISAGSIDGRKMVGLGFDVGVGSEFEREDTELEEGEAWSYRNDEDSNIDPDDLTYIDEKLQNVLGHFKKDFEGGVSTENLGAKYGGYGSFLIQRSPVRSYSRSPANVQNNHSHKSPTCLTAEGGNHNLLAKSNGCHSVKNESASSDHYKAPSRHDPMRQTQAPNHSTKESVSKIEAVDKSANINEPRSLKVRIKVGSDSLSAKKNVAIYSGLGLVSPSSSCDDSPMGSEWLSNGFQFPGADSPSQIIRTMTSLPIFGGHLLSPLPEALARLTEKLLQDNEVEPTSRHNWGSSVLGSNGMTTKIVSVEDRVKAEEKNHLPPKGKKDNGRALDVNLMSKNQADFNMEACEDLIGEALKLPLLSDFHGTSEMKRDASIQKANVLLNAVRHEPLMPILSCDGDWNGKRKGNDNLAVKVAPEEKVDLQNVIPSYQKKDGDSRGEVANSLSKTDANDVGSKSMNSLQTGHNDSQKQKNGKKSTSIEQEGMKLPPRGEQVSSGSKKILKGSHIVSGHKNSSLLDKRSCKKEVGSSPQQKDLIKARDKYKEFFGDMIEDGDALMDSPDEPSVDRLKTNQVSEKGLESCESESKERSSKGAHEQLISRVHPKRASEFSLPSQHVPPIGESAHAGAPVEHWVQCDKCLKWRLLPFGTKEDGLPENWLCSMLDWLPGMNSCSITEEETTKAVARLYQPKNLNMFDGVLSEVNPGAASNYLHPERSHQDAFPVRGMKHGLKEVPNSKHALKNKSLTAAVGPPLENELHFQRNSSDPVLEATHRKKKSKKKHHDNYSSGGHSKSTKREGEREPNQDSAKASKKMKIEDDVWISTRDTGNEMLIHESNNEMLISGAQKYQPANDECSSRSSKGLTDDSLQNSVKKLKFQAQILPDADCLDAGNDDDTNGVVNKRKVKSSLRACSPISLSGKITNKNDESGQKEARLSVPEEKASSSSRQNSRPDKKRKGTEDHQLGIDVDDHRYLKRELVCAATSSSSKVSDSQRSKSILRDVKSSPVESVSSSPFRTLDSERYPSGIKNVTEKDSFHDAGILNKDNSTRSTDAKADSVGERSRSVKKNLCENNNHQYVHDLKYGSEGCLEGDRGHIKHSSVLVSSVNLAGDQADSADQCNASGFLLKQSAKDSSWSKDKNKKLKSEPDKGRFKMSENYDDLQDHAGALKDETKDIKMKFQDKSGCNANNLETESGGKKKFSGIMLDERSKKDGKVKSLGQEATVVKANVCSLETGSVSKKKAYTDNGEKRSRRSDQDKREEMELDNGKENAGNKKDLSNSGSRPYQGNGGDASGVDARGDAKDLKEQMSSKKSDMQNGIHSSASKHQLSNVHRVKERDAPSPMRRDSHNLAAINALKEAKDLKHLADRLKNSGSADSTGFYFEAALKFLHGACLLESSGSEISKRGDLMQSMQVYSSTAKLCEFCAHEYEKSKDLACAALAYKCMEVAYLRVTYSSHPTASRDRHELQTSLQMVPPGESPSSSASDIDNASNPATAEKAAQARDGNSPHPAGNHVIPASSRPNFVRLLKYMQDVNSAMEASRKSKGAFAAAKAAMKQADSKEGFGFVKRVLNFNFHDVDGLLRLVRVAVEAIKQ